MTFINKILEPITALFSSSSHPPKDNGPIYQTPNDVIALFFSFLSGNKANLGRTCKLLNNIYLLTTPEALCRSKLLTALEKPAEELVNETFERKIYAKEDSSAQPKLNNFWATFSEQMKIMNLGAKDNCFAYSAIFAGKIIKNCSIETPLLIKSHLPTTKYIAPDAAKEAALHEFSGNIFHYMIDSYAELPIQEITPESFDMHCNLICGYFSKNPRNAIEAVLHNAIRRVHSLQELNALHEEYLNPSADAPRFVAARAALEANLIDKKTALITSLIALQGPTTVNENTVETALRAEKQMEVERNEAFAAFLTACQESSFLVPTFIDPSYLHFLISKRPWDDNDDHYQKTVQKLTNFLNEAENFLKASSGEQDDALGKIKELFAISQQKYQDYMKQCKVYVYLDTLHDIEKDLQPEALDTEVHDEMALNAAFYSELARKEE